MSNACLILRAVLIIVQQNNSFPERLTIYDFCFEKKTSGQWVEWMDTIDKALLQLPTSAKVPTNTNTYFFARSVDDGKSFVFLAFIGVVYKKHMFSYVSQYHFIYYFYVILCAYNFYSP